MMVRWQPDGPDSFIVNGSGRHGPGAVLPGVVDDYPESVRPWLFPVEAAAVEGPSAPALVAKPAPIDAPAPVASTTQQARPDLSGLHWRKVAALADALGYDGDDRSKAARLAWLDEQPAAAVADALKAQED